MDVVAGKLLGVVLKGSQTEAHFMRRHHLGTNHTGIIVVSFWEIKGCQLYSH